MDEVTQVVEQAVSTGGSGQNLIVTIIMFVVAVVFVAENVKKLVEIFGIETKFTKREKYQMNSIDNLKSEMEEIRSDDEEVKQCLGKMQEDINRIFDELKDMKNQQNIFNLAKTKDRIGSSFRYFKERDKGKDTVQWTSMEKESFTDLIDSYEYSGGTNSFVHTLILPEIKHWEVVD